MHSYLYYNSLFLINGVTSRFFKGKSGLRQGDPISPLLFAVVMNVLSYMLNWGAEDGILGYHPGCAGTKLTHLAFAEDLLIFLDGIQKLPWLEVLKFCHSLKNSQVLK